jgi:hypothetical protein
MIVVILLLAMGPLYYLDLLPGFDFKEKEWVSEVSLGIVYET